MNELNYIMFGFWFGYFFVVFLFSMIYLIYESYHRNRYWKFMVENKQVQQYENWNVKNDPWKKLRSIFKRGE